ncbi:hypothetical protein LX24_02966 [Desulfallas thermosapovorans DSM 6562]|uniref:Uncharacterized protein n=1 Tax=Desulfallas thermosapovorans DSM 6562 TaxID=1121431 RepID=A0A5S4ZPI7_9FIRM|nr:hypothetical protein LX24_02966 [Desulfallas thermosapovorans DSM 6562]
MTGFLLSSTLVLKSLAYSIYLSAVTAAVAPSPAAETTCLKYFTLLSPAA